MAKIKFYKGTEDQIKSRSVEDGALYVATDTKKIYVDDVEERIPVGSGLELGNTSSTAFRGDYGTTAYNHAVNKGKQFASGLYKITTNSEGHVTAAQAVTKTDITNLGIPSENTDTNTTYSITKSGSSIILKGSDGSSTSVMDSDTNYEVATDSEDGLMSSEDKTKLDGIASGANNYVHPASPIGSKTSGLYKIATDANGHVTSASAVSKADITALGIPAQDTNTNTTYTLSKSGSTITLTASDGKNSSVTDSNTTYTTMKGATSSSDGSSGLVPAPTSGASNRYLRSDGTWTVPPDTNTTYTLGSFGITVSADELNYTDGVSSNIQTQLNNKANASTVSSLQISVSNLQTSVNGKANITHSHSASDITSGTFSLDRIPTITDSKISSISASKLSGTISSANLPSYVDDVLEYDGISSFPETGEAGKIYVDTATNKTYRWGGSSYVEISASLALGTTSSTAFRGDYGNTAYTHATAKGNAYANGLYKITTNSQGHVTAATAVTKSDITALGIPAQDTNTNTTYTLSKSGSTISLKGSDGSTTSVTDSDTNTTYGVATDDANGLMSSEDKTKLDGIAEGANKYVHPGSAAGAKSSGLYKITTDSNGHVTAATAVSKSDITALGIPGQDTNTTYSDMKGATSSAAGTHGLVPAPSSGASNRYLRSDGTWSVPPDTNTDTNTTYTLTKSGSTITLTGSDGKSTSVTDSNTTYSLSSFGVTATAAELNKLDGCTATVTELNYLDGVSSNIQTQLNGKASSSHTHSYAGSSSVGGAANSANQVNATSLAGKDLNDYTSSSAGHFYYGGGGNDCTNKPSGIDNFGLIVFQSASGWITQLLYGSDDKLYMRRWVSDSWTSWVEIYSSNNKPTPAEIGAATSSHTHNYAGSSSAGGAANSAVALTTSAGSSSQPVYFSGGKPVAIGYTIAKSVPSNAVFTDTNTWIAFKGATTDSAGTAGYAPAPSAGAANRYLRSDGTWSVPPDTNTTYTLSSFGITATAAELNYCDGVTSNIQTQLNGKASSSHTHNYAASDIVTVSSTQPTSSTCKIWIKA